MALSKKTELFKIDSNAKTGAISVRVDHVILEYGVEISRSVHRHALAPYFYSKADDGTWTRTETDISEEEQQVQDVANALWTDEVKEAFRQEIESSF